MWWKREFEAEWRVLDLIDDSTTIAGSACIYIYLYMFFFKPATPGKKKKQPHEKNGDLRVC